MRYYVSKAGEQPAEISQQQFYNMIRRKGARKNHGIITELKLQDK